ncbi:hypothetical protein JX265_011022 [Neoarthrinium moseri]|uniref:Uncharacterized protein n=1 Tax=Neoarthrinium moseri TaxID=1658444 RepID=A0A9P9WD98_9PEZI|nr:hypothetical protein JX265_011022 [Neoarthrinium moseri]
MASVDAARPSSEGPRPFSRFQEGSMNDRTSAAPPVQFLGPEAVADFEKHFYPEASKNGTLKMKRVRSISRRRERPLSAQAQLQTLPYDTLEVRDEQARQDREDMPPPPQRKSGFFERVRDVFGFGSGKAGGNTTNKPAGRVQQEMGKRASLQQPPTHTRPMPMPIPSPNGVMKSYSQSQVPQLPGSFHGHGAGADDRPSREEILQSYNQLMATGFFKAHAIQSTRQPGPGPQNARKPAPLSPIPSPERSSVDQPASGRPSFSITPSSPIPPMPTSLPPPPPLFPSAKEVQPRPSWESFRYPLRGRKRGRTDSDDNVSESASFTQQASTAQIGLGKRVSKKLRKMPSALIPGQYKSDGVVRLVPSISNTPSMQEERAVRMRSPSPAAPGLATGHRGRRPGSSSSAVSRSNSGNRLRKRMDKSPARGAPPVSLRNHDRSQTLGQFQTTDWEPMEIDSGVGASRRSLDHQRERDIERVGSLLRDGQLGLAAEPLCVVPDMNRGIPSVPRIPDHFKRGGMVWDENAGMELDIRFGEAL